VIQRVGQGPLDAAGDGPWRAEERPATWPNALRWCRALVRHRARVVTKDACQGNCIGV
jgi:hypothetical protein